MSTNRRPAGVFACPTRILPLLRSMSWLSRSHSSLTRRPGESQRDDHCPARTHGRQVVVSAVEQIDRGRRSHLESGGDVVPTHAGVSQRAYLVRPDQRLRSVSLVVELGGSLERREKLVGLQRVSPLARVRLPRPPTARDVTRDPAPPSSISSRIAASVFSVLLIALVLRCRPFVYVGSTFDGLRGSNSSVGSAFAGDAHKSHCRVVGHVRLRRVDPGSGRRAGARCGACFYTSI